MPSSSPAGDWWQNLGDVLPVGARRRSAVPSKTLDVRETYDPRTGETRRQLCDPDTGALIREEIVSPGKTVSGILVGPSTSGSMVLHYTSASSTLPGTYGPIRAPGERRPEPLDSDEPPKPVNVGDGHYYSAIEALAKIQQDSRCACRPKTQTGGGLRYEPGAASMKARWQVWSVTKGLWVSFNNRDPQMMFSPWDLLRRSGSAAEWVVLTQTEVEQGG